MTVASIAGETGNVDLRLKMLEPVGQLEKHVEQVILLKTRVGELEDPLKLKPSLEFRNNAYWIKEGDKEKGPFCSRCWDGETKLVNMHKVGRIHVCPTCKTKDDYSPPQVKFSTLQQRAERQRSPHDPSMG